MDTWQQYTHGSTSSDHQNKTRRAVCSPGDPAAVCSAPLDSMWAPCWDPGSLLQGRSQKSCYKPCSFTSQAAKSRRSSSSRDGRLLLSKILRFPHTHICKQGDFPERRRSRELVCFPAPSLPPFPSFLFPARAYNFTPRSWSRCFLRQIYTLPSMQHKQTWCVPLPITKLCKPVKCRPNATPGDTSHKPFRGTVSAPSCHTARLILPTGPGSPLSAHTDRLMTPLPLVPLTPPQSTVLPWKPVPSEHGWDQAED